MERQRLMVGYDLCADYSQISYYNTEKEEPDSVNFDGQNEIPTVLCRLFSNGEWLAGQQALKAAEAGNGVLVRDFIVRIAAAMRTIKSRTKTPLPASAAFRACCPASHSPLENSLHSTVGISFCPSKLTESGSSFSVL